MFQFLQMIDLTAGYVASILALSGWAWFQSFFRSLGINIDAISYESSLTRIDYYLRPGVEALRRLFTGAFADQISEILLQNRAVIVLVFITLVLLVITLLRVIAGRGARDDKRPLPVWRLRFLSLFLQIYAIVFTGLVAVKAGEWMAAQDVGSLSSANFPRVEILFKKETSSSAIRGIEKLVLRKIFMDRANLFVFSEKEKLPNAMPPIYVISLSEVSQLRLLQD